MLEYVILAVVIITALIAHFWIFAWIRFKADEGTIMKFLEDSGEAVGTEELAAQIGIAQKRVAVVCAKSTAVRAAAENSWEVVS